MQRLVVTTAIAADFGYAEKQEIMNYYWKQCNHNPKKTIDYAKERFSKTLFEQQISSWKYNPSHQHVGQRSTPGRITYTAT